MSPEQAIERIDKAIAGRENFQAQRWAIVWEGGEFLCVPAKTSTIFEFTFVTFDKKYIEKGLTSMELRELAVNLANFSNQLRANIEGFFT